MSLLDEIVDREELEEPQDVLTFEQNQQAHFDARVREKWQCDTPGHGVCVLTRDGQHFKFSGPDVTEWVNQLCLGQATTSQPPDRVLESANNGRPLWNRADGSSVLHAVPVAPARSRSSSISSSTSACSSSVSFASSGVLGPGYLAGKLLKYVGERSLFVMEDVVMKTRAIHHRVRLKGWERGKNPQIVNQERAKLLEMLGDALEMSMPSYPDHINKGAYTIGRDVQRCLHLYPEVVEKQSADWFCRIQICLVPLLLARISSFDVLAGDLAWELLDILTRVPLTIHDPDATPKVVRIIASELAYSKCTAQHSWLGLDLLRIVETELRTRLLTKKEMRVIRDMAVRRQAQVFGREEEYARPWEVALFAQCASQDEWFKHIVQGPRGLDSLVCMLSGMLADCVPTDRVPWEAVALTLRTLAFLSEHDWVASDVKPEIVVALLRVYRRDIPEKWFCTRYWAMDTIWNMVSHRPELCRTLNEQGVAEFATLMTVPRPRDKAKAPMREDYRKEATKRAEELFKYLNKWTTEWTPDSLPKLEFVSTPRVFWLED